MVQINFARREVKCKLVYYGPGLSGKTTNIEKVHELMPTQSRGQLTSIATEGDRTLFFDFLPLDLGDVAGMSTKFQIYTVPGQVYYNGTRKLVLQGADGVVFVADSNPEKKAENLESLQNLADNLAQNGVDINTVPLVLQYNKRDLPNVMSIEEMNAALNPFKAPITEAVAYKGEGVLPTLKQIAKLVLESLNREYGPGAKKGTSRIVTAGAGGAAPAPSEAKPMAPVAPPRSAATPAATAPPRPSGTAPAAAAVARHAAVAVARPAAAERTAAAAPAEFAASAPPKFVPKSPSKPVRSAPAVTANVPEPEPSKKGGVIWVVAAVVIVGAAAAVYFLVLR